MVKVRPWVVAVTDKETVIASCKPKAARKVAAAEDVRKLSLHRNHANTAWQM
jgi:hypothetical protein